MKTFFSVLTGLALLFSGTLSQAQKPQTGCIDAAVTSQAEGIKLGLSKKGLVVFQEDMFKMSSMEPIPVAIKLQKGINYQIIFVGSEQASKLILEVFDGKDKKIDELVERSMNNIVYSFTPTSTDVYLFTFLQKKGLKNMCGYFGVMTKKIATAPAASPKKQVPPAAATPAQTTKPTGQPSVPNNQRPNPNRTKATREAQQQKSR